MPACMPGLKWDDIASFRIRNGIDIGRDALGFRPGKPLYGKNNLTTFFDIRNVHMTMEIRGNSRPRPKLPLRATKETDS